VGKAVLIFCRWLTRSSCFYLRTLFSFHNNRCHGYNDDDYSGSGGVLAACLLRRSAGGAPLWESRERTA
jgi:hypothetical protein